jgi:hypothetical protein
MKVYILLFHFMPLLYQLLGKTVHLMAQQAFKYPWRPAAEISNNAPTRKS